MSLAIEVADLTKHYGKTSALAGLDLTVETASVVAVLGPNGAGKTTAVRILSTLLLPDSGIARVCGLDVVREASQVRQRIALTGQFAAVDERLTGRENLEIFGRLYHLDRSALHLRSNELIERFELTEAAGRPVQTYSGGMRRRLDVAAALLPGPDVLFLDEPTTGLDPRSRLDVWELVSGLVNDGTTVLLTTQYLDEADRLAHDIVIVDGGKAIAKGTPDELKALVGGERLVVTLSDAGQLGRAAQAMRTVGRSEPMVDDKLRTVAVAVSRMPGLVPDAVRALDAAGTEVVDVELRTPTLDDVFLSLTGHAASVATPLEAQP